MRNVLTILFTLATASASAQWTPSVSSSPSRLRGVSAASDRVAWASGAGGTVLLTTDGGATWMRRPVSDSDGRDFRDVQSFNEREALVLAIGPGEESRIYATADGGATWTLRHVNRDPDGFLDALAFWDRDHGLALGDPVGGRFVVLATDDGGATWTRVGLDMPEALPGEGAFAASGTCVAVQGDRHAWFGTGGGRVFRSDDRGRTWTAHATPIPAGNGSSGVFSLAFRDELHGVAVGGDYKVPDAPGPRVALTRDGGRTWTAPTGPDARGYRSAVAFLSETSLIGVGPTGADRSDDGGASWRSLGDEGFHAVAASRSTAWAVGEEGRIARLAPDAPPDR